MTEHHVTPVFDDSDVVFTICPKNGVDHAVEFLSTISVRDQAKFQRYLERLRDGHHVKSPENMRHLATNDHGAELHELKSHRDGGLRLYIVKFEGRWYATHGVKKVPDRRVPREISRAWDIFDGSGE